MRKPRLSKKSRYKNGYFDIRESKKYIQPQNSDEPPMYRSSYEYLFMLFAERNNRIQNWSSEPFAIPYFDISSNKMRNYWIDFTSRLITGERWWIEVKDSKEIEKVNKFARVYVRLESEEEKLRFALRYQSEAKNYSKWIHARQLAKENGAEFKILSEIFLRSV